LNSIGDPVLYIKNPAGVSAATQHDSIAAINQLNKLQYNATKDPEILTRVAQYEMAFKMQSSVPDLTDMSKESKQTLDMYGAKRGRARSSHQRLLVHARRWWDQRRYQLRRDG